MLQSSQPMCVLVRKDMNVGYDIARDVLIVKSDFGELYKFSIENIEDFVDWLTTDRKYVENWSSMEFRYRHHMDQCVLTSVDETGLAYDLFRFPRMELPERLEKVASEITETLDEIVGPVRRKRAQGVPESEILMSIQAIRINDLPVIWKRSEDETWNLSR